MFTAHYNHPVKGPLSNGHRQRYPALCFVRSRRLGFARVEDNEIQLKVALACFPFLGTPIVEDRQGHSGPLQHIHKSICVITQPFPSSTLQFRSESKSHCNVSKTLLDCSSFSSPLHFWLWCSLMDTLILAIKSFAAGLFPNVNVFVYLYFSSSNPKISLLRRDSESVLHLLSILRFSDCVQDIALSACLSPFAIHADQAHIKPHDVSLDSERAVWLDKAGNGTPVCAATGSSSTDTLASAIFPADGRVLSMMSDGTKFAGYHPPPSSAGPSTSYTLSSRQLKGRQEESTSFDPSGSITSETVTPSRTPDATPPVSSDAASVSFSIPPLSVSDSPTPSITIPPVISTASSTQTPDFSETQSSSSWSSATSFFTSQVSTSMSSATPSPSSSVDSASSSLPPSSSTLLPSTPLTSVDLPPSTVAPTSLPTSLPTSRVPRPTITSTRSSFVPQPPPSSTSSLQRSTPVLIPVPSSSRISSSSRRSSFVTPVPSTSSSISPTSSSSSHSTRFTTTVIRTVFTNGKTTTVTTVIETNTLSTDIARPSSGIARNTGAIIGIAISAAVALIVTVCLMFFACKRFKSRRSHHGSTDNILGLARETSWRPPIDGDDESYMGGYGATMAGAGQAGPLSRSNSNEDPFMGDRFSGEGGNGSAESANAGMARPLGPVFGGQHLYVPGMAETSEERRSSPENGSSETQMTSAWHPGLANMLPADDEGRLNNTTGSNYSTTSLTLGGDMSSQSHGGSRSQNGLLKAYSTSRKRGSVPGPRAMPEDKYRRHSSTPPTAFLGTRQERSPPERSPDSNDKGSIRSFIGKLRNSRHMSLQSMMTIRGNGNKATSQESITTRAMTNLYSPSLLNPPIPLPQPSPALLHFPRGVTGNSYTTPSEAMSYAYMYPNMSSVAWPPVTLPPAPSPVPTDNSSMVEGLLHPRLQMSAGLPHQASVTSLRDHEDYTRPINGLVNNHIRSTTTFDTHDTMSEYDDSSSPRIGTAS
ncbi:hypothetical protein CVT24_005079 [Panaeolus cyanescens]|uniref:REJ domain-containing protein n=1 Tax=Panaeolus cyanescens TaxID=181874 RepID=A0A409YB06_9AGAR|nr:hypothetical protein CVT24_005079 [Panaeolus cyanescens]